MDHFCYLRFVFVFVILSCSLKPCGHLLRKGWPLGSLVCDFFLCFVTFPYDVLDQVWYLIVSISDLCPFPYFDIYKRCCNDRNCIMYSVQKVIDHDIQWCVKTLLHVHNWFSKTVHHTVQQPLPDWKHYTRPIKRRLLNRLLGSFTISRKRCVAAWEVILGLWVPEVVFAVTWRNWLSGLDIRLHRSWRRVNTRWLPETRTVWRCPSLSETISNTFYRPCMASKLLGYNWWHHACL